ncbi:MAG TPA: 50S ribosomal protein L10 [Firmicutes bacterium]|nr:50S ribosomal protein L10 [Bacillota bacterium]
MGKRQVKEGVVENLKEKFAAAQVVILTDYRGLNVKDITELRRQLREEGIEYKVVKNTLTKLAANKAGITDLDAYLEGPTAIAFSFEDPVQPAKILTKFAKAYEQLEIKAGVLQGKVIDIASIKELAELPSREVLLSKVLGAFQSPLVGFAGVLQGNLRNLVYVLDAVRKKKEESA